MNQRNIENQNDDGGFSLTFDDVSIIPNYSEIIPSQTDTSVQLTPNIKLNIPILSAAMDTVTEHEMAIAIAQQGGLGVIHKNMSIDEQSFQVRTVKRHDGGVDDEPFYVYPYHRLVDVKQLIVRTGFSSFPVIIDYSRYISAKKILVGFLTYRDLRFQTDDSLTVEEVMTPYEKLVVATSDMSRQQMKELMIKNRVEKLPVVNMEGNTPILVGLITIKDMEVIDGMPYATRDSERRLQVAAAIGISDDDKERAEELIDAGVDAIVIESAHGHSLNVIKMVDWLSFNYPKIGLIAGNVVTESGVDALYHKGAHCVKVGIRLSSAFVRHEWFQESEFPNFLLFKDVFPSMKISPLFLMVESDIRVTF